MASDGSRRITTLCLKHDRQLRCQLQHFLNQISGPARKNPLICESDVKRITKAICTCSDGPTQRAWDRITAAKFTEAHNVYKGSTHFRTSTDGRNVSLHQEFYNKLHQKGAFTESGSSADRLVYILHIKVLPSGVVRPEDILDVISPIHQRPSGEVVHVGSLKEQHVGRYIGRGGTGIREAVHGIPVGDISLRFNQNQTNSDFVDATVTFSCRPRHIGHVIGGLRQRLSYFQEERPTPLRLRMQPGRPSGFGNFPVHQPAMALFPGQPHHQGSQSEQPMDTSQSSPSHSSNKKAKR